MYGKKISLTLFLTLSCIGISLLPVLIYCILSMFIFDRGINTINKANLSTAIYEYAGIDTNHINNQSRNIRITTNFNDIPTNLTKNLPHPIKNNILYRAAIKSQKNDYENLYCLLAVPIGEKIFYAYQNFSSRDAEIFVKPQVIQTIYILLGTGAVILIFLLIFSRYLIKRITEPTRRLSNWANNLNLENINNRLPELIYPELYNIAKFIQKNLANEYANIKREEIFWRYCSHELRTPISVIRVGIELLQKKIDNNIIESDQYNSVLQKLRRSSHSMSTLIETVLWIGNSNKKLDKQECDISEIINEIIQDFRKIYCIDKSNLNVFLSPYKMNIQPFAARIVLENIIRNAFQHSIGDEICITQIKNTVKVINKLVPDNALIENTGFGLGIELVKRLTGRLGWDLKVFKNDRYNVAIITLN